MKNLIWNYGPIAFGIVCCGGAIWEHAHGFSYLTDRDAVYGNLYSAVFSWSAIQTGFLFAAFGYLAGGTSKFIEFIEGTQLMFATMGYVRRATYLGFLLTFVTLPLMVFSPNLTTAPTWLAYTISIWFGLFIWSLLAFLRVAYIFGHVANRASRSN